jgi:hypothetical protein
MSNDMFDNIEEKIEGLFGHPENFSPENMQTLINETLQFFNELKQKLASPNEKDREEAKAFANALKTKLEEKAMALCQSLGMDLKTLENYIKNPANFSSAEWQAMSQAQSDLDAYKQEIAKTESASPVKGLKKKRAMTERIIG